MNKKQAAITGLLLLLMGSLFLFQIFAKVEISNDRLVDNNIGELKEYDITSSNLKFCLPSNWTLKENVSNGYILYQGEFRDNENKITGLCQLINSDKELKEFADRENENATIQTIVNSNKSIKTDIGQGVKYNVTTKVNKGTSYTNINYYIRVGDGKLIKVCFTSKESDFKESNLNLYDSIISSIEEKDK
ncbi:MAG: hypothetical protein ACRC2K_00415 [Clostridium sp.]